MDNRYILFGLNEIEGVGWKTILKLISRYPEPNAILEVSADEIAALGIKFQVADRIATRLTPSFIEQKLQLYMKKSIQILTLLDDDYPAILKEIAMPPWVLYFKGDISIINQRLLGMVGTRTPTAYGKRVAEELAASLSKAGFGIVSGLAKGIDSKAHLGALQGKAKTAAVLGCAIDQIYPRENTLLFREIEKQGILLSEYPIGTPMRQGMFPQRNRIIAGLSLGVIVVEAAERSGSLITADYALEESRDVFGIPGMITSPQSQGIHTLFKQGAKIVTCVEDIIEDYRYLLSESEISAVHQPLTGYELTDDEQKIIQFMSIEPVTIDELLDHSQFTFGHLHAVLLSLLLKKAIKQLPGSAYRLA